MNHRTPAPRLRGPLVALTAGAIALGAVPALATADAHVARCGNGKPCPVYVLGEEDNGLFYGIGTPHPRRFLSLAGSESFFNLKWNGWGRKQATARGRFSNGRDPSRPVRLVAFGRGTDSSCSDRRAYSRMHIKVSGQPRSTVSICQ